MREGSPTGGPSFFQASRGSAANDLGRVDDALGDQIAVPAGLRVEAVVVLVLLEELSDDDGTVFTGALTARGSATRCPRYGRIGTMVQQRDTSGCITTPALDANLMAAPLIEKQKPLFQALAGLPCAGMEPHDSVSLRCYPCVFYGCVRRPICI